MNQRRPGFTLVELMIVLSVAAVLSTMAVPSMASLLARHRLKAVAHHLQADLALARQEAQRRGQVAHVVFRPGANWCYAVSLGVAADCHQSPAQGPNPVLKVVHAAQHPDIVLLQAQPMALDANQGSSLLGHGHALFANSRNERLLVQLSLPGRASLCAPGAGLVGMPGCRQEPPPALLPTAPG